MDLIDKKLLCELDNDCSQPISRIAKKLRIGRNVAEYRIKKLEKEKVIQRYITTINSAILGFQTYKIYLKINQAKSQKEFVEFIKNHPNVIHCLKTEGYFDYTVSIAEKNIKELDEFLIGLRSKFRDLIIRHYVSIAVYTKVFKLEKLLLEKKEKSVKSIKVSSNEKEILLDEKDRLILKSLSQAANMGIVELSDKTKLSLDIVKYRLKKLENSIIISSRAIFDFKKIGYYHYVFLLKMKEVTKESENKLDTWCHQNKNVAYYGKKIGEFDFEINAAIKDIDEFNDFMQDMKNNLGNTIESYELLINSDLIKLNYLPI